MDAYGAPASSDFLYCPPTAPRRGRGRRKLAAVICEGIAMVLWGAVWGALLGLLWRGYEWEIHVV
ncbi:MAG TPA: hypothetical protein VEB23_10955, partial [Ramlibacter sp.]|nr:hypothetical protein [Ramlibacter sp.]